MNTRSFYTFVIIALLVICSTTFARAKALDEIEVLNIARKAVATNETWIDRAEFEKPEWNKKNGTWSVFVQRTPLEPGGHRFLIIDKKGKVISYIYGK